MRRKKWHSESLLEITLTPLLDTALVLLIVFMLVTPVTYYSCKVTLPHGLAHEHKDDKDDYLIAIDLYGSFFKKGLVRISHDEILSEVKNKIQKTPYMSVVLFVDSETPSGIMISLIDDLKNCGINHVYCKTQKKITV